MRMLKIEYFNKGESLCADDFHNELREVTINLDQLSSYEGLYEFILPLSGERLGIYYGVITMVNGDVFCLDSDRYKAFESSVKNME